MTAIRRLGFADLDAVCDAKAEAAGRAEAFRLLLWIKKMQRWRQDIWSGFDATDAEANARSYLATHTTRTDRSVGGIKRRNQRRAEHQAWQAMVEGRSFPSKTAAAYFVQHALEREGKRIPGHRTICEHITIAKRKSAGS